MENKKPELRVLNDNVLLIQYTQKERTQSGIIIPNTAQETQIKIICIVSTVGPNVQNPDLKEGTFVIIPRHTGQWVEFDGGKYVLVKEDDILAIIEGLQAYEEGSDSYE